MSAVGGGRGQDPPAGAWHVAMWSLAGVVAAYVGGFLVLVVDAVVLHERLWHALPLTAHGAVDVLYAPLIWLTKRFLWR